METSAHDESTGQGDSPVPEDGRRPEQADRHGTTTGAEDETNVASSGERVPEHRGGAAESSGHHRARAAQVEGGQDRLPDAGSKPDLPS